MSTTTEPRRQMPTNGGRPPGAKSMRVKAARLADKSLKVLDDVQSDETAPYMARVTAAQSILALAGLPAAPKPKAE
jgi:hypothetical protein